MSSDDVYRMHQRLKDWEGDYQELQANLEVEDLYLLWITLHRLSRTLTGDYSTARRNAALATVSQARRREQKG